MHQLLLSSKFILVILIFFIPMFFTARSYHSILRRSVYFQSVSYKTSSKCVYPPRGPSLTSIDDDIDEIHAFGEGIPQVDVMERNDAALPLCPFKSLSPLEGFLPSHLVLVELGEIVNDNGNGQRDYQDTTYTTHTADHLAERGRGVDVAVSDGGHRDARPPKGFWNAYEFGPGLILLSEVGKTREYKDAHRQEEHQQAQLLVRVTQGEAKALQPGRVAGQLQDPQDPHYTKDLHYPAHVLELVGRVLVRLDQEQRYEVWQYCQQVDHI